MEYTMFVRSNTLSSLDNYLIGIIRKAFLPTARVVLFLIFMWLGALKVFGLAIPSEAIFALHLQLAPSMAFNEFYMVVGVFEVVIGLTIIIRGFERAALIMLGAHLIAASTTLLFAADLVWRNWFVPSLTGEHVVKNIILDAIAIGIVAQLAPIRRSKPKKVEEEKKK